ncbi:MAG TPA: HAMP domain-containing sensor histidine kinase [Trueperaceae bacterium]|nr:HAMP domain-containing sensor histidine kinase [Trueperaceae bacterium]
MSLRRTIFLAVFLAVFATAAIEGVLDVIVDRVAGESAATLAAPPASDAGGAAGGLADAIVADRLLFDLVDIPLMLLIAVVIAWFIARRLARPLKVLTDATRKVAEQSFPQQVAVPAGNDELAQLSRSFNAMSDAIHGFMDRERAFTRYASHELRTPLSAMRLQIERSEMGLAPAAEVLPVLKKHVTQLEEILVALLALARSPGPDPESRLLAPVLKESLATFPAEQRDRFTVTDDSPAQLKVTHSRLLQQALTNLLDNALQYGSGNATVNVVAQDRSVTFKVRDGGPGVAPDELERVTEPFYRGVNTPRYPEGQSVSGADRVAREPEGLGLGLSFVAFIAKALEGNLTLHNTDTGLEATLTLPIVDNAPSSMVATA